MRSHHETMEWAQQLDNGRGSRGSRPRCVLLVDGERDEVAQRLTALVDLPGVSVSADDRCQPRGRPVHMDGSWDTTPSDEVDLAATCTISDRPGLLLMEAKAYSAELSSAGKTLPRTPNGWRNHERIGAAIAEANEGLGPASGGPWALSRDSRYQISNRFAWAWKLATLGVPVVLVYLGFLNAEEMADLGRTFRSEEEWNSVLIDHSDGIVDPRSWGKWLDIGGTPMIPVVRAYDQPHLS